MEATPLYSIYARHRCTVPYVDSPVDGVERSGGGGSGASGLPARLDADAGLGAVVRGWVEASGFPNAVVARRAGVSASTLHRVVNGQVDPSVGTVRELAAACGMELRLAARRLADPGAAAAARLLLEDGYEPSLPGVDAWVERLRRQAGDDPVAIVEAAGLASAPLHRPTARLYASPVEVGRVASAGSASGGRWALSGMAGLKLPGLFEALPTPSILWCEDVRRVEQLLADAELTAASRVERTSLAVVEADEALFTNFFENGRVRYVAPIQIVLDCFSIGGVLADLARREVGSW